ncbi:hypothetical protein HK405_014565, partial [Cladochytrium tenue]
MQRPGVLPAAARVAALGNVSALEHSSAIECRTTATASEVVAVAMLAPDAAWPKRAPPALPATALTTVLASLPRADAAQAMCVSRAWAAVARPQLYAAIRVHGTAASKRLAALKRPHPFVVSDAQLVRLGWLVSADPARAAGQMTDVLAFVRALELDGVPADTAASFLEILARAGGRPTRLSLFCIDATAPFVAALAPVAARVVDLEFDELKGDDISELFAGR